jgi:dimethylhistidine N-methyltransferase
VRAGLTRAGQKELPCRYFYDEIGTALFEAITLLPEYGLTRADGRILRAHAAELIERLPAPLAVVELGSGSGSKTRWVLEALGRREPAAYYAIDVSRGALDRCRAELAALASVIALPCSYLDGLREATRLGRHGQSLLVLFLGSTIGNFSREEADAFLRAVRGALAPGDALLLGADLQKPVGRMLAAYDDAIGVTAAFNRNLLARINRELGGDFDLPGYAHEARWNAAEGRVEMHLRARTAQRIRVRDARCECELAAGETIWTESCRKFRLEEIPQVADRAGFRCEAQWVDEEWPFSENLLVA